MISITNNTTKVFITIASLVGVFTLIAIFVISPLIVKITQIQTDIHSSKVRLLSLEKEIQNYRLAIGEIKDLQTGQDDILGIFPRKENMVSLVEGVEISAAQAQASLELEITDYEAMPKQQQEKERKPLLVSNLKQIEEIPYHVKLTGNYRNFVDVFIFLEHQPFFTQLRNLNISAEKIQIFETKEVKNTGIGTMIFDAVFFLSK